MGVCICKEKWKTNAVLLEFIVRTALIFVDDSDDDLKRELGSDEETTAPEVIDDYEIPNTFENFWD